MSPFPPSASLAVQCQERALTAQGELYCSPFCKRRRSPFPHQRPLPRRFSDLRQWSWRLAWVPPRPSTGAWSAPPTAAAATAATGSGECRCPGPSTSLSAPRASPSNSATGSPASTARAPYSRRSAGFGQRQNLSERPIMDSPLVAKFLSRAQLLQTPNSILLGHPCLFLDMAGERPATTYQLMLGIIVEKVEDRGGAIVGESKIDLYYPSHTEALQWGRRKLKVKIILPEDPTEEAQTKGSQDPGVAA